MCVIVMKPIGVNLPSEKVLRECWDANPDGAGFAVSSQGNAPQYFKGFMTFESLMATVTWYDVTSNAILIHFRIATHGGINQGHTHPFPLVNDFEEMRKLEGSHECVVAHNGVFHIATPDSHSDTMQAISEMGNDPTMWWNCNYNVVSGSKLAILRSNGEYELLGYWMCDGGIFYSNQTYKWLGMRYTTAKVAKTEPATGSVTEISPEEFDSWTDTRNLWETGVSQLPSKSPHFYRWRRNRKNDNSYVH